MKILKNLTVWQNYIHYLLLTIGLVVIFHIMGIHKFHTDSFLPNLHFVYLYLAIFIIDTIVHFTFSVIPEPFRWED